MGQNLQSLIGILAIPLLAWLSCASSRRLPPAQALRMVLATLALQAGIALILIKVPQSRTLFDVASGVVQALQRATDAGMQLAFGYLAGGPPPFDVQHPEATFLLAFRGLPLVLLISALTRLLYHWGILQKVVQAFAVLFRKVLGVGGPVGTSAAANIFVGMVEAPLLIRPYLAGMGDGALLATMAVGMATIAGTVMALYATSLEPVLPGAAGHVLAASLMNAPAALVLARLSHPDGFGQDAGEPVAPPGDQPHSSMDAIVAGTSDGVRLLVAVTAMLVVATALVAFVNIMIGTATGPLGLSLTIEKVLGWVAAPFAFIIGIPWTECAAAGALLAKKVVLNELVAYLDLAHAGPETFSPRTRLILTYALCGFANLGSLGIMVGGLSSMAPRRQPDIVRLGPRAVLVGVMSTMLSGAIIGAML
ncbi:MAG: NupC/NupG family nucleoside CNT transporter [Hyphomicrobiaceae bacterium]